MIVAVLLHWADVDEPTAKSATKQLFGDSDSGSDTSSSDSESSISSSSDSDSEDEGSTAKKASVSQVPESANTEDGNAIGSKKRPAEDAEEDLIDGSAPGEEAVTSSAPGKRARVLEDSDSD